MRGILVVCFAVAVGRAAYPYAAAGERRVGENAPYQAVEAAWIDEGIATAGDTGEWSGEVLYERETGRATLDGEYVFTPNTPSTGNYVTLKVAMSFTRDKGDTVPDADAQGAVRLGRNGFQVWTGSWLDVAAAGVTPIADREYELSFVFDYAARRYSVSVLDAKGAWRRLEAAGGAQAFPIAAKADKVSSVTFDGDTRFHYLKGSQTGAALSRPETRRREAAGDPVENAAAVPTQVFDPAGIWMASKTWFSTPAETRRTFRRGFLVPPEFGWAFLRLQTGPPDSAGHFDGGF